MLPSLNTYITVWMEIREDIDMTAGTDSLPDDPQVAALGRVRQVPLPSAARALSTLPRVDYEDARRTGPAQDRTAEQRAGRSWKTPRRAREPLSKGWLGSACGSVQPVDRLVLGWEGGAARRTPPGQRRRGGTQRRNFATFVYLENRIARTLWAAIASRHRQVVRDLLEQASDHRFGATAGNSRPDDHGCGITAK